ncbi:MAG: SRPBCC family protein [Ideonella sp.]|nr:SRPBCC family protein [Ideonella sp.]
MSVLKSLFKWLAIVVLALAAVLVVGGWFISPRFSVTRSTVIAAAPDKVYALVADPRRWTEWTVWNQRDPAMQVEYSGPTSGVGAAWAWQSKTEGDGKMTFTAAEPGRRVAFDLYFPDFGTTSQGELRFAPESAGTKVSWTMNGDFGSNPLFHWFALMADSMTGPDFEAGLANLKTLAEKP